MVEHIWEVVIDVDDVCAALDGTVPLEERVFERARCAMGTARGEVIAGVGDGKWLMADRWV